MRDQVVQCTDFYVKRFLENDVQRRRKCAKTSHEEIRKQTSSSEEGFSLPSSFLRRFGNAQAKLMRASQTFSAFSEHVLRQGELIEQMT